MDNLRGKIAWVTGAGSGIGESAALKLAEAGAVVVLTGRREAPLSEVAGRIAAAGGTAHVRPADLAKADQVRAAADWIGRELGRLDILVSNAGGNITDRAWS
ncbi:MAG: SDR family NAD(P)-dependent oxidoreductase, partial [Acetobacteraceae bacterium]|nr:SDR family NAD(P)-dependent oxidoreductase [Acetobacteraceae bacterium]